MVDVYLYTTRNCPYCIHAKRLLSAKGQNFHEIPVDGKPELRREMAEKAGQATVPQIWINNQHIGGCDDLMQLDVSGRLDQLLSE